MHLLYLLQPLTSHDTGHSSRSYHEQISLPLTSQRGTHLLLPLLSFLGTKDSIWRPENILCSYCAPNNAQHTAHYDFLVL